MKTKCLNWLICHNEAKPGHDLCRECIEATVHIERPDTPLRRLMDNLEKKPRTVDEAWRIGR